MLVLGTPSPILQNDQDFAQTVFPESALSTTLSVGTRPILHSTSIPPNVSTPSPLLPSLVPSPSLFPQSIEYSGHFHTTPKEATTQQEIDSQESCPQLHREPQRITESATCSQPHCQHHRQQQDPHLQHHSSFSIQDQTPYQPPLQETLALDTHGELQNSERTLTQRNHHHPLSDHPLHFPLSSSHPFCHLTTQFATAFEPLSSPFCNSTPCSTSSSAAALPQTSLPFSVQPQNCRQQQQHHKERNQNHAPKQSHDQECGCQRQGHKVDSSYESCSPCFCTTALGLYHEQNRWFLQPRINGQTVEASLLRLPPMNLDSTAAPQHTKTTTSSTSGILPSSSSFSGSNLSQPLFALADSGTGKAHESPRIVQMPKHSTLHTTPSTLNLSQTSLPWPDHFRGKYHSFLSIHAYMSLVPPLVFPLLVYIFANSSDPRTISTLFSIGQRQLSSSILD